MGKSRKSRLVKPATLERGEARYFHGRTKILDDFKKLLGRARDGNSGTSFLIQAAPGAGKTALLAECGRIAGECGYAVAEVEPSWFLDLQTLHKSINSSWKGWRTWLDHGSVSIDHGPVRAEIVVGGNANNPLEVIKSGEEPLLLLLDEAQRLARIARKQGERFIQLVDMLKVIHAGGTGRPLILLAAGLGATAQAFKDMDISRFDTGCRIDLGRLKEESTRAILQDWLLEDGRAKGNPARWIDGIAKETHGWPQHIMAYVLPALRQLKLTGGEMTEAGLQTVLKEGREGRDQFYQARVDEFESKELRCIALAVADVQPGERISKEDIMDSLLQDFSREKARTIFRLALHKGLFDRQKNDYIIPIPSMHDWLASNFGGKHR